ncbi:hypothetical protein J2795_002801 [Chryseobacterium bernardetii]|uniref:Uncharacterized protein n=1 Tax=Chryseobacterium bernardetii TaxID=1241978 RepID=A0ACC6IWK9_9FLAO|nr:MULTISPECIES: hypothetical protein [Chryseobacterium]MDR6371412.1 hypothetical protein [Chryseobacterium vietnamense]MDR6442083.1 hypothetical protein [Chryseobacterium bernardetii]
MEKLISPQKLLEDWRTDDFINKQFLCSELRRRNTLFNDYILEYDVNNYDWHAEQTSIKDNKENIIKLKTYLNKNTELVDLVQRQNEIEFDIDLNVRKLYFRLKYFFHRNADTEELRRNKAIMLETFSYEEFKNLIQYVGYGDFEKDTSYNYLGYFSKIYEFYFNQASTPEQLIFLYTNTPDFVFERIVLDNEKVMQHLITLTEYDDTGFFSGWKDGSSALVNIFKTSSPGYIMNRFKKEPELCNRIYYNLDDISYVDEKPQSNRIIFAGIMRSFAQHHTIKEDAPIFKIKKGYRVNTKVNELSGTILGLFGQSDEETFFLQQQQEQYIEEENYVTDDLGVSTIAKSSTQETIYKDLDEGRQFLPLEMVYLEEEFDGVTTITKVPAIYVKALADAEKWAIINDRLRIAADIAAIILGVGTLATTGNPYLLLAAAADLSLALPDLTIQAFREEIRKLPGGEQFLKDWDLIYGVGGAIVAAPQLIVSVYRGIFVLLPKAAKNVQQGLKASAISLFLDLNAGRFERSSLRLFQQTEWVIPSAGFISKTSECDALIQNGAFFMELDAAAIMESIGKKGGINPDTIGSISSNRRFALVYKGEIIAEGSRYDKAYQNVLQEIKQASYSSEKVGEILDDLVVLKNRTKPSKPKNIFAKPKGIITKMPKVSDDVTKISLELENEAAEILAKNGFDIEQNPFVSGVKNPDYKIEGKIFDCYSPTSKDKAVRGIWTEVKEKIIKQQTKRVVINLKIWEGDMVKLQKQFSDWAIEGLEEVMYITKEGKINHLIIKK